MVRIPEEKKGGIRNLNPISEYFNEVIANLDLVDVRMSNSIYTWNNKRTRDRSIACRLDHFLVLESIMMEGGELIAVVPPLAGSDHWPI